MSFEAAKTLGGVGAILATLSFLHWIIGVVGLVLLIIALKGLSEYYEKPSIFNNALIALILGIVGIAIIGVALIGALLAAFGIGGLTHPSFGPPPHFPLAFLGTILVGLIATFVVFVISAVFFRRSLNELAESSGESLFRTAGLLYLIGAVLLIILVGGIVILISFILIAIAFFTLKPKQETTTTTL